MIYDSPTNTERPVANRPAWLNFVRWMFVPSLDGVEEFEADPSTERRRIRQFWSENPNLSRESNAQRGSERFFQEVDASRHSTHWPLYELVPFAETRGLRVLEIGCGLGTDAAQFARSGAEYVGLDVTQPAARLTSAKLRAYGLPGDTMQADAERLPLRAESVDVAYSWGVIHHTPDTQACVDELYRVLRPGGKLILMLYSKHGWWYYRILWHWLLLSLLRAPVLAWVAQRLLGARRDRVERWATLYRRDPRALFARLVARETDTAPSGVNPHSKVYDAAEARQLVHRYAGIRTQTAHWIDLPALERLLGRSRYRRIMSWLGSVNGPCLYVFATKPRAAQSRAEQLQAQELVGERGGGVGRYSLANAARGSSAD
jgi:ubiquinone/menaquinone biosynthesis C-methylase UbiE